MNLNSPNSGQKAENLEKNFSEIKSLRTPLCSA